ncbi:eukaryotic translation initiation factor 4E binding protein 2, isoform CRA_a [Rattus norvegicus]|uniref:Eukaryotic translation initiation factor 4E binding protein 2, isoform CRA_a n=1 Tax=Rattus norvegicus TaxID=10116 RepID=A6K3Z8_RAT|nr:eukaryotic translation initiation factor 4E binding protein 2, isoform CRA_a [Rattus norvegicus]
MRLSLRWTSDPAAVSKAAPDTARVHLTGPVGTPCTEKLQSPCPLWVPNNGRCALSSHIFPSPALCPLKVRLMNKPMDYSVELTGPQTKAVLVASLVISQESSCPIKICPQSRTVSKQHLCLQGLGGEGGLVPIAVLGLSLSFPAAYC